MLKTQPSASAPPAPSAAVATAALARPFMAAARALPAAAPQHRCSGHDRKRRRLCAAAGANSRISSRSISHNHFGAPACAVCPVPLTPLTLAWHAASASTAPRAYVGADPAARITVRAAASPSAATTVPASAGSAAFRVSRSLLPGSSPASGSGTVIISTEELLTTERVKRQKLERLERLLRNLANLPPDVGHPRVAGSGGGIGPFWPKLPQTQQPGMTTPNSPHTLMRQRAVGRAPLGRPPLFGVTQQHLPLRPPSAPPAAASPAQHAAHMPSPPQVDGMGAAPSSAAGRPTIPASGPASLHLRAVALTRTHATGPGLTPGGLARPSRSESVPPPGLGPVLSPALRPPAPLRQEQQPRRQLQAAQGEGMAGPGPSSLHLQAVQKALAVAGGRGRGPHGRSSNSTSAGAAGRATLRPPPRANSAAGAAAASVIAAAPATPSLRQPPLPASVGAADATLAPSSFTPPSLPPYPTISSSSSVSPPPLAVPPTSLGSYAATAARAVRVPRPWERRIEGRSRGARGGLGSLRLRSGLRSRLGLKDMEANQGDAGEADEEEEEKKEEEAVEDREARGECREGAGDGVWRTAGGALAVGSSPEVLPAAAPAGVDLNRMRGLQPAVGGLAAAAATATPAIPATMGLPRAPGGTSAECQARPEAVLQQQHPQRQKQQPPKPRETPSLDDAREALMHGPAVSRLTAQVLLTPPPARKAGPSGGAAAVPGDAAAAVTGATAAAACAHATAVAGTLASSAPASALALASRDEVTGPPPRAPPPPLPPLEAVLANVGAAQRSGTTSTHEETHAPPADDNLRRSPPSSPLSPLPLPALPALRNSPGSPHNRSSSTSRRAHFLAPGLTHGDPAPRPPPRASLDDPHRLVSARDLTASLFSAPSWVHVAQLVHRWPAALNGISVAAAFKRLAKCCDPKMLDSCRPEGSALLSMLQHLCFQAEQHLPTMGPREVSTVLWSLASLGYYPPPDLAAGLVGSLLSQLRSANNLDLANGLWAVGVLGWPAGQQELGAVWRRMVACYRDDRPSRRSLVVVLNNATKLGLRLKEEQLLWLEAQLVAMAPHLNGQDVSNVLSSMTRLVGNIGGSSSSSVGSSSSSASSSGHISMHTLPVGQDCDAGLGVVSRDEGISSGDEEEVAGAARPAYRPQAETLRTLLLRVATLLPSLRGDEACMLLHSMSSLRFQAPDAFTAALLSRTASQRGATSHGALAILLWSAGRLRRRPPGWWLAAVLEECVQRLPYFTPSQMSTALYGLAQLRAYTPEPLFAGAFLARTTELLPYFSSQEVANTAWALAHLPPDCVPAPTRGSPLWAALSGRCRKLGFAAFTPQGLANLLWGLAVVAVPTQQAWRHAPPVGRAAAAAAAAAARARRAGGAEAAAAAAARRAAMKVSRAAAARVAAAAPAAAAAATAPLLEGGGAADLKAALDESLHSMDAVELSMTVWALARLRIDPGPAWLGGAVGRAAGMLTKMPLEGLSSFVHALTWIQSYQPDPKLLSALEEEVCRRLAEIRSGRVRKGLFSRLSVMRSFLEAKRRAVDHEKWIAVQQQKAAGSGRRMRRQRFSRATVEVRKAAARSASGGAGGGGGGGGNSETGGSGV